MSGQPPLHGHFVIDKATKTAIITMAGHFQPQALVNLAGNVYADPAYQEGMNVLLDARRLDVTASSQADMRVLGQGLGELARNHTTKSKIACLVANNLAYGMARMFEMMHTDTLPYRVRTFRDHSLALQWLSRGTAPVGEG